MDSIAIVGASLAGIRAAEVLRSDGFSGRISLIGAEKHKPYDRPPLSKNALAGELAGELTGELGNLSLDSNLSLDNDLSLDNLARSLALVKPEAYSALELEEWLGFEAVDLNLENMSVGIKESAPSFSTSSSSSSNSSSSNSSSSNEPAATDGAPTDRAPTDGVSTDRAATDRVAADAILIATGTSPHTLPNPQNLKGIYTLRSIDDCLALQKEFASSPQRVAVIGAGFIGCEVAATAKNLGLEVSIIEMAEAPLKQALGKEMGEIIAAIHLENGVDLRLNARVEALTGSERVEQIQLSDGSVLEADVVIIGIGVFPNTKWLEGSGLALDNGVICDETCLAAPGICAAGDVARWQNRRFGELMRVEHWDNAIEQSRAAARRLLAGSDERSIQPYAPIPWFWSDQYDHKIQLAGLSSPEDKVQIAEGSVEEQKFTALYERDGKITGVLGFNSPRQVMKYRQKIEEDFPLN